MGSKKSKSAMQVVREGMKSLLGGRFGRQETPNSKSPNSRPPDNRPKVDRRAIAGLFFAAVLLVGGFQNCDNARLKMIEKAVEKTSAGKICADPPNTQSSYTKVMFLVDKSGSNGTTDPQKTYRHDTIRAFWDIHKNNPNVSWGFVAFNGNQSLAYINDGSDQSAIFSADQMLFQAALDRLRTDGDNGATPYKTAIQMTRSAIVKDQMDNPGQNSMYLIIMITDGEPTDYGSPPDDTAIYRDIADLVTVARSTFSTVYYGPNNPTASNRLRNMAMTGLGKFLDTNLDGRIPLDELIGVTSSEPWRIKEFVVANLNAAPCDDGTMGVDSDADGLCDRDEIRYNTEFAKDLSKRGRMNLGTLGQAFDPQKRNSFHPVYSDAFFYRYIVFNEMLDNSCTDTTDEDRDLLNLCEERFMRNGTPLGPTGNWTDKMGMDSDPFNFDSDGDGFIDSFEFFMTRNKSGGMDHGNRAYLFDGFRLDEIFLQYRNWRSPKSAVPYQRFWRPYVDTDTGQHCGDFQISNISVYKTLPLTFAGAMGRADLVHDAEENTLLFYFVQAPEKDPNAPGELRYHFQKVKSADSGLDLNSALYRRYSVGTQSRVPPTGN